jgi:hypothetical protein
LIWGNSLQELKVLFEVPEHFVSVGAFVASAQSAEKVIATLNNELFAGKFVIELVVAAPQPGSLRQVLKVVVKGVTITYAIFWSAVQLLETDIAKDVIRELSGESPAEIASRLAKEYKEKREASNSDDEKQGVEKQAIQKLCEEVEGLLSRSSGGALSAERDELEKLPISEAGKYEIFNAQAQLFEKCIEDKSIAALHFEDSEAPPILRNGFPSRAIRPKRPESKLEDGDPWNVTVLEIVVTSPNLWESDQDQRRWKGKTTGDKPILFVVDDMDFWTKLHNHEIAFGENDRITAQLATRFASGRTRENRVVRVLKFNQTEIGAELDENALNAILGDLRSQQGRDVTKLSLFDDE